MIWSSPSNIHPLDSASGPLDSFALQKKVHLISERSFHILGIDHGKLLLSLWFSLSCTVGFDKQVSIVGPALCMIARFVWEIPAWWVTPSTCMSRLFLNICTYKIWTISMHVFVGCPFICGIDCDKWTHSNGVCTHHLRFPWGEFLLWMPARNCCWARPAWQCAGHHADK